MAPRFLRVALVACAVQAAGARGATPTLRPRRFDTRALIADEQPVGAAAAVPRLRGGEGGSMLQSVRNSYISIPPLTRTWFSVILAFAGLTQANLLPPEAVQLDAAATVQKLQLWRPVTAASFFGGIGAQLLQKMYYLIQFGKELETTLGIGEYARVLASCAAMLSLVFHLIGWPFTGDGLIMAITVLCCQQNPNQQMSLYGLRIPYQFLPIAQLVMSYMFTQQIPWPDIVGLFVGYINYYINDQLKPDAAVADKLPQPKATGKPAGRTLGGGGCSGQKMGGAGPSKRKSRIASLSSSAACGPGG